MSEHPGPFEESTSEHPDLFFEESINDHHDLFLKNR
jgi:hypothetical protein